MSTRQAAWAEQALSSHVASTDGILDGGSRSRPSSGFLSGSATANRNAAPRQRTRVKQETSFSRRTSSSFQNAGPSRAAPRGPMSSGPFSSGPFAGALVSSGSVASEQHPSQQSANHPSQFVATKLKEKAMGIMQTLTFGPTQVEPPADDVLFAKLEPNSNTTLSSRFTSNKIVESHLDCRTYIPISKLYSICLPVRSDDGDFTVPIEGEWVTMAVLTHLTEIRKTICRRYDYNGNEISDKHYNCLYSEYRNRKGSEPDDIKDEDNPERLVKRHLPSRDFRIATLTDLGQPLDRNETRGDSMVQMILLAADESYLDAEGKRRYTGGSHGIFEMFNSVDQGTLVCLLNPLVRKGKDNRERLRRKGAAESAMIGNGLDDKMMSLSARSQDCALIIGMAADYGCCTVLRKDGTECGEFVDSRTRMHVCSYHFEAGTATSLKARQEFANGTSKFRPLRLEKADHKSGFRNSWKSDKPSGPFFQFKTYEEMACSQSRAYVFTGIGSTDQKNKSDPSNHLFRVDEHLGREQEARRLRNDETQHAEDERVRARLAVRSRDKRSTSSAATPTPAPRKDTLGVAGRSVHAKSAATATSTSTSQAAMGHGAKAIQEALKKINASSSAAYAASGFRPAEKTFIAPNEKKRTTSATEQASGGEVDRATRKRTAVFDPFTGKMRQENDSNKTSVASAKLLARHNATAASLPKPIMNSKRCKGVSSVRPPPGQYFHALDDSDDELDAVLGAWDDSAIADRTADDDDSDLEIID